MSEQTETVGGAQSDEMLSGLFAQLVMQQANMATLFLGKVAHPESGEVIKDIDAARLFIDQLAMLETKTRGNLNKDEANLLKQTLMGLRMAFVEAIENPESKAQSAPGDKAASAPTPATEPAGTDAPEQAGTPAEDHPKKFSKKY